MHHTLSLSTYTMCYLCMYIYIYIRMYVCVYIRICNRKGNKDRRWTSVYSSNFHITHGHLAIIP